MSERIFNISNVTYDWSYIEENYSCGNGCIVGIAIATITGVIMLLCLLGFLCHVMHPAEEEDNTPFVKKEDPTQDGEQEENGDEELKADGKQDDTNKNSNEPVTAGGATEAEAQPATEDK